jgi:hypothetical protein
LQGSQAFGRHREVKVVGARYVHDRNANYAALLIDYGAAAAAGTYRRGDLDASTEIAEFPSLTYVTASDFPVSTLWIADQNDRFAFERRRIFQLEDGGIEPSSRDLQYSQVRPFVVGKHSSHFDSSSFEGFDADLTGMLDQMRVGDDAIGGDEKSAALEKWLPTIVVRRNNHDSSLALLDHLVRRLVSRQLRRTSKEKDKGCKAGKNSI